MKHEYRVEYNGKQKANIVEEKKKKEEGRENHE